MLLTNSYTDLYYFKMYGVGIGWMVYWSLPWGPRIKDVVGVGLDFVLSHALWNESGRMPLLQKMMLQHCNT
ncbi:hypothetical protein L6452_22470 [Arctium lappa]|uniref:Uncharacterized protein n=1 Tax=Arctium lappa TaxID=4217 RepID=A0ACB9B0J2_ARCLA|nr:hypothetical protein L6452_22470 [Arctium lappa]